MRILSLLLAVAFTLQAHPNVYEKTFPADVKAIYTPLVQALEAHNLFVAYEIDIGKRLENFKTDWGRDYNQNRLEAFRSIIVCNGWYANAMSNADTAMTSLCPLRITVIQKNGKAVVLFARPGVIAKGSGAEAVAKEIEAKVIEAIETVRPAEEPLP
jgi:uncharacterized protein (DUF302 family)